MQDSILVELKKTGCPQQVVRGKKIGTGQYFEERSIKGKRCFVYCNVDNSNHTKKRCYYRPTLTELIYDIYDEFVSLEKTYSTKLRVVVWEVRGILKGEEVSTYSLDPLEAVAKLWLKINKK